jgi:hypothetical protein
VMSMISCSPRSSGGPLGESGWEQTADMLLLVRTC